MHTSMDESKLTMPFTMLVALTEVFVVDFISVFDDFLLTVSMGAPCW